MTVFATAAISSHATGLQAKVNSGSPNHINIMIWDMDLLSGFWLKSGG